MRGDDIAERLLDFAVRIIKLAQTLPKTMAGKHISGQILGCGTSAGANYEEARGAESKADFKHKLGITLKELREALFWLKVLDRSKLLSSKRLADIIQEADELCRIIGKSILTTNKSRKT